MLNDKLDILTKGNKDFHVTASYLLDLATRADELFKLADDGQRSKLVGFLVSNLQLNDKKLSYTVNYPFNKIFETKEKSQNESDSSLWCEYRDSNPGPSPWQGDALTAELHSHTRYDYRKNRCFFQALNISGSGSSKRILGRL